MPAKMTIEYQGKKGTAALNAVTKKYSTLYKDAIQELSPVFFPQMTNKIRRFHVENYEARQGWKHPSYSGKWGEYKDKMLERGDSFDIPNFGKKDVIHGASEFGRLTDTIHDALSGQTGAFVHSNIKSTKQGEAYLQLEVGLNEAAFEGDTTHNISKKQEVFHTKKGKEGKSEVYRHIYEYGSYMLCFSDRVTPGGTKPGSSHSVFIWITQPQKEHLMKYMMDQFSIAIKKVVVKRI